MRTEGNLRIKMKILLTIHDDLDEKLEARVWQSPSGKFSAGLISEGSCVGSWHQFASYDEAAKFARELVFKLEPGPSKDRPAAGIIVTLLVLIPAYILLIWLLN